MNIPDDIITAQSAEVARLFRQWADYMEQHVEFWDIPGELDIHTQGHCERVLLHALRLGEQRGLPLPSLTALAHASIFHDTRRKDNYLDTGHGDRAADYYKTYSQETGLEYHPETFAAIKFHDRDDRLGEAFILREAGTEAARWTEVYHDMKDADALDRLRLGTWCLDKRFLRTAEARTMVDFAQTLVERSIPHDELMHTYSLMEPFRQKWEENRKKAEILNKP